MFTEEMPQRYCIPEIFRCVDSRLTLNVTRL